MSCIGYSKSLEPLEKPYHVSNSNGIEVTQDDTSSSLATSPSCPIAVSLDPCAGLLKRLQYLCECMAAHLALKAAECAYVLTCKALRRIHLDILHL